MSWIVERFVTLQGWLFQSAVLPSLYALGLMDFAEPAFDATEFVLLGLVQIAAVYLLLRPLELWRPAEHWQDRSAVRSDVLYTFLNRVGLVPIAVYAVLTPLVDALDAQLRAAGYIPRGLEDLVPVLAQSPLAAFCVYLLVLDLADYWRHRLQHRLRPWWALHVLHHSQRQMTFWNDDRNHLLDELIAGFWFAGVAFLIGVPPEQFVAAVMLTRFVESLSHANVRFGFGALGERLLVGPRFHRTHHALGVGHEGARYGCNFATLLPLWDMVFGTANFAHRGTATGVRDQLEGRDYGESFLAQQWLGLKRLVGRA
ncbi:MAG: fatty acid hydroxylase [Betaproteobacteria bacterium]|nr:fatty acid hydroxylase [Betaproteobacteria bacterium]